MGNKQLPNTDEYLAAMVGKNSKKVNDKEKKEELNKDRTWKVIGTFDKVHLNCLETKSESRRRREKRM